MESAEEVWASEGLFIPYSLKNTPGSKKWRMWLGRGMTAISSRKLIDVLYLEVKLKVGNNPSFHRKTCAYHDCQYDKSKLHCKLRWMFTTGRLGNNFILINVGFCLQTVLLSACVSCPMRCVCESVAVFPHLSNFMAFASS